MMKEKQIEITVLISEIEHLEYMRPCCSKSNIRRNEGFTIYICINMLEVMAFFFDNTIKFI